MNWRRWLPVCGSEAGKSYFKKIGNFSPLIVTRLRYEVKDVLKETQASLNWPCRTRRCTQPQTSVARNYPIDYIHNLTQYQSYQVGVFGRCALRSTKNMKLLRYTFGIIISAQILNAADFSMQSVWEKDQYSTTLDQNKIEIRSWDYSKPVPISSDKAISLCLELFLKANSSDKKHLSEVTPENITLISGAKSARLETKELIPGGYCFTSYTDNKLEDGSFCLVSYPQDVYNPKHTIEHQDRWITASISIKKGYVPKSAL